MKRFIFIITMLLFMITGIHAQYEKGDFTIQPKIGINYTCWDDDDKEMTELTRFALGVEGEYHFGRIFGLSAGLIYSQQGTKEPNFPMGGNLTTYNKEKMDYLNVPILANVYIVKGFAVKAGIQPGFLIHDNIDYYFDAKKVDVSIPIGLAYECMNICLDARYNLGLTNVYKSTLNNDSKKQRIPNHTGI